MKGNLLAVAAMSAMGVAMMSQTATAQVIVRSSPVIVQNTVVTNGGFYHPPVVRHYHPPAVIQPFPYYGVPHRVGFGPGWGGGGWGGPGWGTPAFGGWGGPGWAGPGWGGGTSVGFGVVRPGLSFGVIRTFP